MLLLGATRPRSGHRVPFSPGGGSRGWSWGGLGQGALALCRIIWAALFAACPLHTARAPACRKPFVTLAGPAVINKCFLEVRSKFPFAGLAPVYPSLHHSQQLFTAP